jgi:hypothetical protein
VAQWLRNNALTDGMVDYFMFHEKGKKCCRNIYIYIYIYIIYLYLYLTSHPVLGMDVIFTNSTDSNQCDNVTLPLRTHVMKSKGKIAPVPKCATPRHCTVCMEVEIYTFLTLALDGGIRSVSCNSYLTPGETAPSKNLATYRSVHFYKLNCNSYTGLNIKIVMIILQVCFQNSISKMNVLK